LKLKSRGAKGPDVISFSAVVQLDACQLIAQTSRTKKREPLSPISSSWVCGCNKGLKKLYLKKNTETPALSIFTLWHGEGTKTIISKSSALKTYLLFPATFFFS